MSDETVFSPAFILPAPATTRAEANILWYEVMATDDEPASSVHAFDGSLPVAVSSMSARIVEPRTCSATLTSGHVELVLELELPAMSVGTPAPALWLNGLRCELVPLVQGSEPLPRVDVTALPEQERHLLGQWVRMAEPVMTLAEVMVATSIVPRWSCGACSLLTLGSVLAASGCVLASVPEAWERSGPIPWTSTWCGAVSAGLAIFDEHCVEICN